MFKVSCRKSHTEHQGAGKEFWRAFSLVLLGPKCSLAAPSRTIDQRLLLLD